MNLDKGTIYLIQPAELVGTKRYKIGCSSKNDLERCKKGYKKGTRFMDIRECDDPFALEKEVKSRFNSKFSLIAGREYFEGNEIDIKKEFNDIVSKSLKSYGFENNLNELKHLLIKNTIQENKILSKDIRKPIQEVKRISVDKNRPKTFENVFLRDTIIHHNKCGNNEYVLWLKDNKHFRRCNSDKSFKSDETFLTINAFTCKNYEDKNKTREKPRTTRNNAFLETFFLNDNGVWQSCDELTENKIATK
jgi:hypothetical protein